MTAEDTRFSTLETPCLLLDESKMRVNISRLAERTSALGVALRPHLKTAKSEHVAKLLLTGGNGPATVSTLAEAQAFAEAGVKDVLYAVGIAPQKLARVAEIRAKGCDLTVILDSREQVEAVVAASKVCGQAIPAMIEIDCDGHRGGLLPGDPALVALGRRLQEGGAELRGVMTHAGESYNVYGDDAHAEFAERERVAAVTAAHNLRAVGLACPVVSVGSTPTGHAARDLTGVTEVRAGVYVFFDLVMAGIGVCKPQDIALSVLTTVIGHQREKGWILIDAGWMALSRDRGTASQKIDQGYGVVCDENGNPFDDLLLTLVNQEHGIIMRRPGSTVPLPDIPLGTRLRILPNHACATASQFPAYTVIPPDSSKPLKQWERIAGW